MKARLPAHVAIAGTMAVFTIGITLEVKETNTTVHPADERLLEEIVLLG